MSDSVSTILEELKADPAFSRGIARIETIPARDGSYVPFPEDLDPAIASALNSRGIERLYSHQGESWKAVRAGRNIVVVTPTASGKTLCYNLPVLQGLMEDPDARALYLFPTKALSQDQQAELNGIVLSPDIPVKICTYDGDTPASLRISARDSGRIVISNPDMLHSGILPNHPKWIKFFAGLKYIVVDELHSYRGVYGSHVANVFRRLKRIAAFYGAKPSFVLCSATIADPKELAEAVIGEPVDLIDGNGAPLGEKRIVLYNPPLVDPVQGIRKSTAFESRDFALFFLRRGVRTILFAKSRIKTELIASYINDALANIYTDNHRIRVEPYRGGLLPSERRAIEKGLRDGTIRGVVSTNALELGIDIGGLDAAVIAGFPGSFSSFWQQSGRAGRRRTVSLAVLVASSNPLDQYLITHPEYFFSRPSETARIDADNPYIYTDHVKCAAFELPFTEAEAAADENLGGALVYLEENGTVRLSGGRYYWSDRSYPAEAISLRSATADNVVIIDTTRGRHDVIGEMDRPSAKEMVFDNAVYIHRGKQFLVTKLDIANRTCTVEEREVDYFTDAVVKTDIKVLTEDEERRTGTVSVRIGDVLVRSQVAKFKKLRYTTHENIGFGEVDQAEEEMQTRSAVLLFDEGSPAGNFVASLPEAMKGAVLGGLGSLVKRILPVYLLCDPSDIGIAERTRDPHFGCASLYIYDRYPGGTGLAEAVPDCLGRALAAALETIRGCPCDSGCPSCIGAGPAGPKPGSAGVSSAKTAVASLIASALGS
jgi:DEAD/DEAH box helicase domain-containing protein